MKYNRPSKDNYYMDLAKSVCQRSTCLKIQAGAVIILNDQVISTGYVGAPRGTKSSLEHGFCLRKQMGIPSGQRYEICRSVHAEQNAIINAARAGVSLLGGDMYVYMRTWPDTDTGAPSESRDAFPCFICKKMLINCGLKRVICNTKTDELMIFNVADWIDEWKEKDIIEDQYKYGVDTK